MKRGHQRSSGFTIIEVMIVLAIAGLIMVVVFMAVPALQRSSRNNQRKTDVSAIASGIIEYKGNARGQLPTGYDTLNLTNGNFNICSTGGDINTGHRACDATSNSVKISFYTQDDRSINSINFNYDYNLYRNGFDKDTLLIVTQGKCGPAGDFGNLTAANQSVALLFYLEANGADGILQCRQA